MSSIYNLSKKLDRKNILNLGFSSLDSNETSTSTTLNGEKPKKNINKKVFFNGVEIVDVESYKLYNQQETCFENLENNTVESCNCNAF